MASVDVSAGGGTRPGHHPGRPRPRHVLKTRGFPAVAGHDSLDRLPATAAAWAALLLAASGALLVLRRSGGGATTPAGIAPLLATTIVGIVVIAAIDRAAPFAWPRWLSRAGMALAVAALVPPLSPPDGPARSRFEAIVTLASVATVTAVMLAPVAKRPRPRHAPRPRWGQRPLPGHVDGSGTRPPAPEAPHSPTPPLETMLAVAEAKRAIVTDAPLAHCPLPPGAGPLQQRFERFAIPADDVECQRGSLLLAVAAGSRSAAGHVGFCPPFAALPQVDVEIASEEIEATIVVAEILPWGVRVECRLDEPADEAIEIPVSFVAKAPLHPSSQRARR